MIRPTLLCVDDDSACRTLYQHLLGCYGYDVVVAEDGIQALETLNRNTVDAVLLDYEMPGMNGSEVAAVMKHRTPEIPIIMVSGCSSVVEDAPRFVDAAVAKGAPVEKLLTLLDNLIRGSRDAVAAPVAPSRYAPLGSALASVALLAYFLPLLWR
jgi:CheY-like chemotaxis protein